MRIFMQSATNCCTKRSAANDAGSHWLVPLSLLLDSEVGHRDPAHDVLARVASLEKAVAKDGERVEERRVAEIEEVDPVERDVELSLADDLDAQRVGLELVPELVGDRDLRARRAKLGSRDIHPGELHARRVEPAPDDGPHDASKRRTASTTRSTEGMYASSICQ